MTPEERAAKLVTERTWDTGIAVSGGDWTAAIASAIREAVAEEREACVMVVWNLTPLRNEGADERTQRSVAAIRERT